MIPRKQRSAQVDWVGAVASAYQRPDRARADALIAQAGERIGKLIEGFGHVTLAWSGGKDSQALRYVAELAGVEDSLLILTELEYPAFLAWATDNMPWGLAIEMRPYGLDWLAKNPNMLFPDTKHAAKWFKINQQDGQRKYMKRTGSPCLLLGRRRADGNFISLDGSDGYRDRAGFWRASPIADWSHEDLLTVLGAANMPLPPNYGWPRGYRVGTGPWPQRQWCASQDAAWDEVYLIDPTVVLEAARHGIPGASAAMRRCAG
jgi:3'-phosphoadenosine 5'-phosphosulfate sulfotransferase (PAPS reductase)/FAD synthetase